MKKNSGQATTEILLLLPVFIIMAGISLSVGYICWQGIKVQQAANLAARIQGQQRVSGGTSVNQINDENGINDNADPFPGENEDLTQLGANKAPSSDSVYGQYRAAVREMFLPKEQERLYVKKAVQGVNSDQIKVVRVLVPPRLFGLQLRPIRLEATAYGGEDSRMFGLPRWGKVGSNDSFYKDQIRNE